jgi:hypothetical protein
MAAAAAEGREGAREGGSWRWVVVCVMCAVCCYVALLARVLTLIFFIEESRI